MAKFFKKRKYNTLQNINYNQKDYDVPPILPQEQYTRDTPQNGIKTYFVMGCIGTCESGKTVSGVSIGVKMKEEGQIDKVWIVSPSYGNNSNMDALEPEEVIDDLTNAEGKIWNIFEQCKEEKELWNKLKEMGLTEEQLQLHIKSKIGGGSNFMDAKHGKSNDFNSKLRKYFEKNPNWDKVPPSNLLFLDDILQSELVSGRRNSAIGNVILKHRHAGLNVIFTSQGLKSSFPKLLRENVNVWCLWTFPDEKVKWKLYEECVGGRMDRQCFDKVYEYLKDKPKGENFLVIDLHSEIEFPFRIGFGKCFRNQEEILNYVSVLRSNGSSMDTPRGVQPGIGNKFSNYIKASRNPRNEEKEDSLFEKRQRNDKT